ncbi:MAG TPA: GMC family oxidoreductase N-terminal domain-containing protein [Acidimicrobiales bacterium]
MDADQSVQAEEFDYVIVGAGSAGCVLASRLSEEPTTSVLLLEAGPQDRNPLIHIPAAFPKLFDGSLDWGYRTTAQPNLANRRVFWPRGRMLGGSSSMNAMMWIRGAPSDFDAWAVEAGPGWSYETLLPYFLRLEDTAGLSRPDEVHGVGGPMPVAAQRDPNQLTRAWLSAAGERGIGPLADTRTGLETGVALASVNQRDGRRVSSADAYLRPARSRRNLVIRTGAAVGRIVVESGRATGVDYRIGRSGRRVRARREVILTAGAINSPQLLMCSGIGPAPLLARLGIDVLADRREVGQNLQDHLTAGVAFGARRKVSIASAQSLGALLRYVIAKKGPLTSNVAEGFGFVRSGDSPDLPDLELLFVPSLFINEGLAIPKAHGLTLGAVLLEPQSRGSISIKSQDPESDPEIDPAYLSDSEGKDAAKLREGIQICLDIASAPSLASEITELVQPDGPINDQTIELSLREFAQTLYHPVGTCRMGTDAGSVVDSHLRVRGVERLRVVDASVIPLITHGHTHAPTVLVAERAADLIRS